MSNTISNAARKFRNELWSVVAQYASEEAEIEAELHGLIEILRKAPSCSRDRVGEEAT